MATCQHFSVKYASAYPKGVDRREYIKYKHEKPKWWSESTQEDDVVTHFYIITHSD